MNGQQTRVVGGTITPWLRATFNVIAVDATGALLGHSIGGWFGATVTGIAASIKAVNSLDKDGRIDANIIKWTTKVVKSFFSSVGPTLSYFDKAGDVHNCTIDKLYTNYGKDKISNMSDANLVDLIINRLVYVEGYRLPANFNYNNLYSTIPSIDGVIQTNDYKLYLQRMAVQKPIIKNECVTLNSFLTGFQSVNEDNSMKYVVDFRNTINSSGISTVAKNNLCVTLSIGFASANFWEEQK